MYKVRGETNEERDKRKKKGGGKEQRGKLECSEVKYYRAVERVCV